jgi:CBS domain-containing protein
MSPRAAARLESMGFSRVHDYEGGKLDWLAFGLPVDGAATREPTIGDSVRRDAPTCLLDERLRDLGGRMSDGWTWCAVVSESGVLLGRIRRRQLAERPDATAREAMENGPSTYRPSVSARELVEVMKRGRFERAYVTDSDGRLWGLVGRQDLEAALSAAAESETAR